MLSRMSKVVNQLIAHFVGKGMLSEAQLEHLAGQGFTVPDPRKLRGEQLFQRAREAMLRVNDRPLNLTVGPDRTDLPTAAIASGYCHFVYAPPEIRTWPPGSLLFAAMHFTPPDNFRFVFEELPAYRIGFLYADLREFWCHPGAVRPE